MLKKIINKYELIIYYSTEEKAFIAEVPELAGCTADGQTHVEAVQNAEIAIEEWIETAQSIGRTIPDTKGKLAYA